MPKASEISFNEGLVRLAGVHKKLVEFIYIKGDGHTVEQRHLIPENVRLSKDGSVVLFNGYDPDRDSMRTYRSDRIRGEVRIA